MSEPRTRRRPAFALSGLLALGNTVVLAQSDEGSTAAAEGASLEEVMVYGKQRGYYNAEGNSALRQAAPLLETPASVFLINSELIADQQSFSLDQILQNDSSVQKSNNFLGAYSSYQVRGFELSNGTNYLRDGRPYFQLASVPTESLERVEVLKGPASVLYGTLAPGGLINMVTKEPTRETTGFVKATYGSDDLQHYHADVGGSITEAGDLRYRVNAVREDSESFRRFFDGTPFEVERRMFAGSLAWDISDRTDLLINADYLDDDRPQDNGLILEDGEIIPTLDYDTIYNQPWSHYNSEVSNVYARLTHRFTEDWNVKFVVHQQQFERDRYDNQLRDYDATTGDNTIRARRRLNKRDYTSYSLDLAGRFETGPLVHRILVGAEQTDIDRDDSEIAFAERVTFTSNVFGPAFPDPRIGIGDVAVVGEEERQGLFMQDLIEVGERWRVLLGMRYDRFDTTIVGDFKVDNVTPRLGVLYLLNEDLSLYGSYSESFEPNGPVGADFDNAFEELDPTVGEMFEVGAKWELYDGNLLLTGALFSIERDGAPVVLPVENVVRQRGLQRHEGFELAASGLVGDNFSLTTSFTYLDAEFVRDTNPDIVGNTPFGVPEYSLSVWGEYQFNTGILRGVSLQGGAFHESERAVDDANSFHLDAYTRIDLGAKYAFELANGHNVTARLTLSNVTDEQYFKARSPLAVNPERPFDVRASLQYAF